MQAQDRVRFDLIPAIYGVVGRGRRLLVLRRQGTGYGDGLLSLPAGHLEHGEDLIDGVRREMREEIGILVSRDDCILKTVVHRAPEFDGDIECIEFYFRIYRWNGKPQLMEPSKSSEMLWIDPERLPEDVLWHLPIALAAVRRGTPFLSIGWTAEAGCRVPGQGDD